MARINHEERGTRRKLVSDDAAKSPWQYKHVVLPKVFDVLLLFVFFVYFVVRLVLRDDWKK
jgi:hypothetical protein